MFSLVHIVDSLFLVPLVVVVELESAREPRGKLNRIAPAARVLFLRLPNDPPPEEEGPEQRLGRGPRDRRRRGRRRPPSRNSVAVELRIGGTEREPRKPFPLRRRGPRSISPERGREPLKFSLRLYNQPRQFWPYAMDRAAAHKFAFE